MTEMQMLYHQENADVVARIVQRWRKTEFLSDKDQRRLTCALQNMRMSCNSTYLLDQETDHGVKADELAALFEDLFAEPEAKAVVFSQWTRTHDIIIRRLEARELGYVSFHGGVPSDKRPALVERFRDDPACRVFLSTDAGSTGLNLQHASTLVNMDLPWNPAILEQRIARIHRMGQKRPVRVINFVAKGTIEEGMLSVLAFKRSLSAGILDGGSSEISLGGSRLNRFMKDVENVTGRMGEGEAVTPAEEVGNIVTADDAGSAEDANADVNIDAGEMAIAQADGARSIAARCRSRSVASLGAGRCAVRCRSGGCQRSRALRRIHGLSGIRPPARKTSKCRCRRRKPRGNLPMRFRRSRTACGARSHDGHDPRRPLVWLDETSIQIIIETRALVAAAPGRKSRHDYEYERNGVADLFMMFAPLEGWRHVKVTDHHAAIDYAHVLKDLSDTHFLGAAKIVLVQDNLSTHMPASLYAAFHAAEARRRSERFEWHYTPKHGSWLDMAESELGVLATQCLNRRIPNKPMLINEVAAWQDNRNKHHVKADWQFTATDARVKLKRLYPQFE